MDNCHFRFNNWSEPSRFRKCCRFYNLSRCWYLRLQLDRHLSLLEWRLSNLNWNFNGFCLRYLCYWLWRWQRATWGLLHMNLWVYCFCYLFLFFKRLWCDHHNITWFSLKNRCLNHLNILLLWLLFLLLIICSFWFFNRSHHKIVKVRLLKLAKMGIQLLWIEIFHQWNDSFSSLG